MNIILYRRTSCFYGEVLFVFFDGTTINSHWPGSWGFSCFLHESEILVDMGEDPNKLQNNLKRLNISHQNIKSIPVPWLF